MTGHSLAHYPSTHPFSLSSCALCFSLTSQNEWSIRSGVDLLLQEAFSSPSFYLYSSSKVGKMKSLSHSKKKRVKEEGEKKSDPDI